MGNDCGMIPVIIPARGGSKGIPKKNIVEFCGKPLIFWTIKQALNSDCVSKVYVSTDDEEIASVSKRCGAEVIERPPEISTDGTSSEEALVHALDIIGWDWPYIVFLQATSPLRKKSDIDRALDCIIRTKGDSLVSVCREDNLCAWQYADVEGNPISVTYDYRNRSMRQDRKPFYIENGSIYIFKPWVLKETGNRLGGKIVLFEMEKWQMFEIDTEEDLRICETLMQSYILPECKYGILNIEEIDAILYDFDGVMTNNKFIQDDTGHEAVILNRSDGLAISRIKEFGIKQVIVSSEKNPVVEKRAKKLGIEVISGVNDKAKVVSHFCRINSISLDKVVYVGNEINDLDVMKLVGWPLCPIDAADAIKAICKYVIPIPGGEGVIRYLLDLLTT